MILAYDILKLLYKVLIRKLKIKNCITINKHFNRNIKMFEKIGTQLITSNWLTTVYYNFSAI